MKLLSGRALLCALSVSVPTLLLVITVMIGTDDFLAEL